MVAIPARQVVKAATALALAQVREDGEAFVETWNDGIAEHGIMFAQALACLPTLMAEQVAVKAGLAFDYEAFYAEMLRQLSAGDN